MIHCPLLIPFQVIPFQDCISAEMANKAVVNVGGRLEKISDCVQDKLGFKQISDEALSVDKKLKEVCSPIYIHTSHLASYFTSYS